MRRSVPRTNFAVETQLEEAKKMRLNREMVALARSCFANKQAKKFAHEGCLTIPLGEPAEMPAAPLANDDQHPVSVSDGAPDIRAASCLPFGPRHLFETIAAAAAVAAAAACSKRTVPCPVASDGLPIVDMYRADIDEEQRAVQLVQHVQDTTRSPIGLRCDASVWWVAEAFPPCSATYTQTSRWPLPDLSRDVHAKGHDRGAKCAAAMASVPACFPPAASEASALDCSRAMTCCCGSQELGCMCWLSVALVRVLMLVRQRCG